MSRKNLRLTLGADPEVFIRDARQARVVPVCGWLGGTKKEPVAMGDAEDGFFVQEDGIAAEYNIPPCSDLLQFANAIREAESRLTERIRATDPEYRLHHVPFVEMTSDDLMQHYPASYTFGCAPEFDAYSEGAEVPRVTPEQLVANRTEHGATEFRFAGGHLHIGITSRNRYALGIPKYVLAAFCDASIGLASIGLDKQGSRRLMYGQAGRFRPTKYGIEYRVLSNYWTQSSEFAQHIAQRAFHLMDDLLRTDVLGIHSMFDSIPWGDVRSAINNENSRAAAELYSYIWSEFQREVA